MEIPHWCGRDFPQRIYGVIEMAMKEINLENGFTFHFCGGTRCIYNEQEPEVVDIEGHRTELSSSAVIDNIDKVISDRMYSDDNGVLVKLKQEQL